ncbi:hypothetical protein RLPCCGM1_c3540 [Rhizobium leguminosarum bv. phaseoli CCGM1]|nr:hypothetical protein RLPCCGM1_c3540 [Rhizobium leguminosarum bv. phaseoli CCGM1]
MLAIATEYLTMPSSSVRRSGMRSVGGSEIVSSYRRVRSAMALN